MFDLCIYNTRIMDPESGRDFFGAIAVQGEAIAAIDDSCGTERPSFQAAVVIDAKGMVTSPGFIDIHTHEDDISDKNRLMLPQATAYTMLRTGVTTMITGNCGSSSISPKEYREAVTRGNYPINCYTLTGNATLRRQAGLGPYDPAGADQIETMCVCCRKAFEEGALGLSFGLQYDPATGYEEEEALCRVAAEYDRMVAIHMRYDYPEKVRETVEEVIKLSEATGARFQISHLAANVYGRGADGGSNVAWTDERIRGSKLDIACDMYPYNVWSTVLQSAVFDEGFDNFNFGVEDLEILNGEYAGQFCTQELFDRLRKEPDDIMVACHNAMPIKDVEAVYCLPYAMLGSDGQIEMTKEGHLKGHPRGAGSPAKFLREFVREKKLFPLMTGLAKLTCLPATRLKLSHKGRLAVGCDADLTVFDPDTIAERAGFGVDECGKAPEGIGYVIVGGQIRYHVIVQK